MFGTLELTRTNQYHIGQANLQQVQDLAKNAQGKTNENAVAMKEGSFSSYLVSAVSSLNDKQLEVGNLQQKLITDPDSIDVQDVTIAMGKAQMTLQLAQSVLDRVIKGWNEITTTR